MNIDTITPVEKRGGIYFKREDLYIPFDFSPVNGSKLRQCQLLVEKNKWAKGIITGTSIKSPQACIAASVAKHNNLPCKIYYGGTNELNLENNKYACLCKNTDAEVSIVSKMAFTSVLNHRAESYAKEQGWLNIRYGFDLSNNLDVFIHSVARQVENIPDNIKNIVVTVGSSITIIGILYGIVLHNKNIEEIFAIGVAPNRMCKIEDYSRMIFFDTGIILPIDKVRYIDAFNLYKGYKYENTMKEEYEGITFHPRYEAKTFRWLKNQDIFNDNTLMWITGSDF